MSTICMINATIRKKKMLMNNIILNDPFFDEENLDKIKDKGWLAKIRRNRGKVVLIVILCVVIFLAKYIISL